jgi:deoxyribonuclease V
MEARGRLRLPVTPREAAELQTRLRDRVIRAGSLRARTVAGVDVSEKDGTARAAVVILRDLEPVEQAVAEIPVSFPYVPGLLSFREVPPILEAWKKVRSRPDVVLVDGQGFAHPRRFGLACHLGVLLDLPSIGCAKSRLIGEHALPPPERGAWSPLVDEGEVIGAALRTQAGRNVVYVSVGHRATLQSAIRVVLECAPRYRLPEPQRRADQLSKLRVPAGARR